MNKYYEMIDHMKMPETQHEQLRMQLMEQTGKKRTSHIWRRYAAAAALVLCLLATAATTYAAVHYQWFRMFFDNGNQESGILEEFVAKASTEEVSAQNEDYKFTVLSHLYSKEQQMGMIICSFQFLTEKDHGLMVNDVQRDEAVVLRKGFVGSTELKNTVGLMFFRISKESDVWMPYMDMVYFADEIAEDGGYLIGIRYNVVDVVDQESELFLSLEMAGDTEGRLRVLLPESEDVETAHFVSERNPQDSIVISPIGMAFTITGDKANYPEKLFKYEILEHMKMVGKDFTRTLKATGEGYDASTLRSETDTTYTWYVQKEFLNLIDVSDIEYIEVDGDKYSRSDI